MPVSKKGEWPSWFFMPQGGPDPGLSQAKLSTFTTTPC